MKFTGNKKSVNIKNELLFGSDAGQTNGIHLFRKQKTFLTNRSSNIQ